MADEQFLLSGDQLGTYSGWSNSNPPPTYTTTVTFSDISPLGTTTDRFFLVRTQGDSEIIGNGQLFTIYNAIDDGSGGLEPDLSNPLYAGSNATPDAFLNLGAGDSYLALGMYGGPKVLISLDGINGATNLQVTPGDDVGSGGDGEISISEIAAANPDLGICFVHGSPIATIHGDVPVEELKVGDLVLTQDNGYQPVRWTGSSKVVLNQVNDDLRPVCFEPNALGEGQPAKCLSVSPAHRIFWSGSAADVLFGERDVLIPAKFLVDGRKVHWDNSAKEVTYWHVLFDTHEIVFSAGLRSESFFPAPYGLGTLCKDTREELSRLFPDLNSETTCKTIQIARRPLRAFEFRVLAERIGGDISIK